MNRTQSFVHWHEFLHLCTHVQASYSRINTSGHQHTHAFSRLQNVHDHARSKAHITVHHHYRARTTNTQNTHTSTCGPIAIIVHVFLHSPPGYGSVFNLLHDKTNIHTSVRAPNIALYGTRRSCLHFMIILKLTQVRGDMFSVSCRKMCIVNNWKGGLNWGSRHRAYGNSREIEPITYMYGDVAYIS